MKTLRFGFTLLEVLVVVAIIALLSSALYVNFGAARDQAQDDTLRSQMQQVRIALESYRAQNSQFPGASCSGSTPCTYTDDIPDLATDGFIEALPDPSEYASGCAFVYYVDKGSGTSFKYIAEDCVSATTVGTNDEMSNCPSVCPSSFSSYTCTLDDDTLAISSGELYCY